MAAADQGAAERTSIYLDYNASTPIDPEVVEEMMPYLTGYYGNPSSSHWASANIQQAIHLARTRIAKLVGCDPDEIIFTSGGSESNNTAIKGTYYANRHRGNHIITTKIEHPAVLHPCAYLETQGARVTYLDVDAYGRVNADDVAAAITDDTILVSIMHANNETGTIQPIRKIGDITRERGIIFHTDAAQSVGKIETLVSDLNVDLLTIAGHKLYAPKGIGALYIRRGTLIDSYIHGAGHESGRRAGTENVPYIAAIGKAAEIASRKEDQQRIRTLTDRFWARLSDMFQERIVLNGHPDEKLPNTLNVSFKGMIGQDILDQVPEIAATTGSACHTGSIELSPVLKAMKVDPAIGAGTVRFSIGRYTTADEIEQACDLLKNRIL
ncbi:cysteine desulfurase [Paenibacillus sp. CCS19]|uniref:cysteine desulfurase family protein n=1 Tax=Paenibacillus sp. CCS19 TaxID=3158387 RepID=UPI00256C7071|nr:cysteine desulfurase family protein [Paenibacillus cellulosilyticus]GMK37409.1 cysteine desulfurase [Paenibacillus cellulosilyticus]